MTPKDQMRESLTAESAYEAIRQKIVDGEYLPSQRLVETQLAQELGFSRHNIRVALDRLHSDGLVRLEPHRGATVATLNREDCLDILVARETLEGEVARLAARSATTEQLLALQETLEIMRDALTSGDFDRYSSHNITFHKLIYQASGNHTIPELISLLRLRLVRLQLRTILIPGRSEQSIAEHEAIYQAIASRDEAAADTAAREHMRNLRSTVAKAWTLVRL
ncbi:MAG TPA: GntR family transcriptional regulator [Limnochordia bacterium]